MDVDRARVQAALKGECRPLMNVLSAAFEQTFELNRVHFEDPIKLASLAALRMSGFSKANPRGTLAYAAFFPGEEAEG
eukprot:5322787-Pyramimonas_sp.AAC.1